MPDLFGKPTKEENEQNQQRILASFNHGIAPALLRALRYVKERPGETANELESGGNAREGQIRKRLSELKQLGYVFTDEEKRHCRVSGKKGQTWRITSVGSTYLLHHDPAKRQNINV